jgi:hypothetical protein
MSVLVSYNLNYSTLDITLPINYQNILFEKMNENKVVLNIAGEEFTGYPVNKSVLYGEGAGIIRMSVTPWLGLISKTYSAYKIGASNPAALIAEILADLDVVYPQSPNVYNAVPGLELAIDTEGKEAENINLINAICDTLCMGVIIRNGQLTLYMLPEVIGAGEDITPVLVENQPRIDDVPSMFYDKINVTYKTAVGATEATYTAGSGNMAKSVSATNVYMSAATAQKIAEHQLILFSTLWKSMEQAVSKKYEIGDRVSYDGYNFFVYGVENLYTHYIIKCYGKKETV